MSTHARPSSSHQGNSHHLSHTDVAQEAEGMLDRLSHSAVGEEAKEMFGRLRGHLQSLKDGAEAVQEHLQDDYHAIEKKIQRNPWRAVAFTAAGAVLIGYLLGRRKD